MPNAVVVAVFVENMNKDLLKETLSFFDFATEGKFPLLKFETDKNWLTVYYHETLTADGKDWKWSILCSQSLVDYAISSGIYPNKVIERIKTKELVNRITLMLVERLRSTKQDINTILQDYKLFRK